MTPQEACNFPLDLENHYGYIYCITFPNNKKYVGQSTRPWLLRWRSHKNTDKCVALKRALNKYPIEQITWELLEYTADKASTDAREQFYISSLCTLIPFGYNLTKGGTEPPISILVTRPILTEEQKQEIEEARKYNTYLREYKDTGFNILSYITAQDDHVCISLGNYMSKIHSRATYNDPIKGAAIRNKLHELQKALRSRPIYCEETKETFSCTREAIEKHPEWNKDKINWCCAKHNKTHLGLHFRYANISEDELDTYIKYWNEVPEQGRTESGHFKAKPVLCIEQNIIYPSLMAAERATGVATSDIAKICRGQVKQGKGLHFTYAAQETL